MRNPSWICKRFSLYFPEQYLDASNIEYISVEDDNMTPENLEHIAVPVDVGSEAAMIGACVSHFLTAPGARCIVFCDRKSEAEKMSKNSQIGGNCQALHGDLSQVRIHGFEISSKHLAPCCKIVFLKSKGTCFIHAYLRLRMFYYTEVTLARNATMEILTSLPDYFLIR